MPACELPGGAPRASPALRRVTSVPRVWWVGVRRQSPGPCPSCGSPTGSCLGAQAQPPLPGCLVGLPVYLFFFYFIFPLRTPGVSTQFFSMSGFIWLLLSLGSDNFVRLLALGIQPFDDLLLESLVRPTKGVPFLLC